MRPRKVILLVNASKSELAKARKFVLETRGKFRVAISNDVNQALDLLANVENLNVDLILVNAEREIGRDERVSEFTHLAKELRPYTPLVLTCHDARRHRNAVAERLLECVGNSELLEELATLIARKRQPSTRRGPKSVKADTAAKETVDAESSVVNLAQTAW